MPNGRRRSRSPVRAINAAGYQTWANVAPRPRMWGDPDDRERTPLGLTATPLPEQTELACPDCGSVLRLGLVRVPLEALPEGPQRGPRAALRAAPDLESMPDFDECVHQYKRDLIMRAMDENGGVMTRAAKALGLKYTTFVAMVHRLGVLDGEDAEAVD